MVVRRMSKETALARNGMLSSYAASRVRRMTPVTVRCQPPSPFTREALPPLRRPPHLVHLVLGELFEVTQALRDFAPGGLAAFGRREHEPGHGTQHDAQQEGAKPSAAFAHSPASASSGADTSAARGATWESRFGLT